VLVTARRSMVLAPKTDSGAAEGCGAPLPRSSRPPLVPFAAARCAPPSPAQSSPQPPPSALRSHGLSDADAGGGHARPRGGAAQQRCRDRRARSIRRRVRVWLWRNLTARRSGRGRPGRGVRRAADDRVPAARHLVDGIRPDARCAAAVVQAPGLQRHANGAHSSRSAAGAVPRAHCADTPIRAS
jgi:hypothetical protein